MGLSSSPVIFKNLVITGSHVQEQPGLGPAGDVRAWNARTGQLAWTFHTVPRPGEPGHETWEGESWKDRSGANVWGHMTVDVERGLVFLPLGCATYDYYGGDRKGANLYGSTLVALDAETGKLKWHFQTTHHDVWDYDLESAPVLIEVVRNGRTTAAVAQMTKQGLLFILDRTTGRADPRRRGASNAAEWLLARRTRMADAALPREADAARPQQLRSGRDRQGDP